MKSSIYKGIAVIVAFLGIIGGIVLGNSLSFGSSFNAVAMFASWVSTALVCAIFFGIAFILEHLERLNGDIPTLAKEPIMQQMKTISAVPEEAGANEWKRPKCGKINQNYVGTCGCDERKPQ